MAQYKEGTVTLVTGSQTVVGVGTQWLSNISIGQMFSRAASGVPYFVGGVTDDTHLQLSANYAGISESGALYSITRDFTPTHNIPYMEKGDIDTDLIFKRAMLIIDGLL